MGVFFVAGGGLFVFIGVNALAGSKARRLPIASEQPPATPAGGRKVVALMWLALGAGFIAAAFLHLAP